MKVLRRVLLALRTVVSVVRSGPFGRADHASPRFDDWQYDAAGQTRE